MQAEPSSQYMTKLYQLSPDPPGTRVQRNSLPPFRVDTHLSDIEPALGGETADSRPTSGRCQGDPTQRVILAQ